MNLTLDKLNKEYSNKNFFYAKSLGVISGDEVLLFKYSETIPIKLDDIKKVFIEKKRYLAYNILLFFCFIFFFYIFTINNSVFNSKYNIFYILINALFLVFSVIMERNNYTLIIIKNNDFIKIKINKEDKNNAKWLISKIKQAKIVTDN